MIPGWRGRDLLTLTWVGLTAILIAAGEGVVQSSTLATFDHSVTSFVVGHRAPASTTPEGPHLARVVADTTGHNCRPVNLTARRRLPLIAVPFVLVAWAGELAAVTLAKDVVGRQRPPKELWLVTAHGQSFPSGQTANAVVVCVTSALLVSSSVRATPAKALTWTAVAIVAVGFSRVELGVHWTTDVLASAVFVTVWMGIIGALLGPVDRSSDLGQERPPDERGCPDR